MSLNLLAQPLAPCCAGASICGSDMKPSNHNRAQKATGSVRQPVKWVCPRTVESIELMKLVQRANPAHRKQNEADKLPPTPAEHPLTNKQEDALQRQSKEVRQLVRAGKRRQLNFVSRQ